MSTNEPTDAIGRPLRPQPAAADAWAPWRQWADSVEGRLRGKADSGVVEGVLSTLERMAGALTNERRAREKLAAELQNLRVELGIKGTVVDLEERLAAIESGGKPAAKGEPAKANVVAMAR